MWNVMLNIFLWKMFSKTKCDAKMHFCTASLFFAKQKTQHFCTAEHFPLENVMLNILQSQMWCWTFDFVKCTRCVAKMHFGIKCICNILFCKNAFLHQQNVRIKCIWCCPYILLVLNIVLWKMFSINKMYASNAFWHQQNVTNALWRTFSKGKCSAVQKCIWCVHFV